MTEWIRRPDLYNRRQIKWITPGPLFNVEAAMSRTRSNAKTHHYYRNNIERGSRGSADPFNLATVVQLFAILLCDFYLFTRGFRAC